MNTDRELLELAAKASSILFRGYDDSYQDFIAYDSEHDVNYQWNPLTDDGDAFRLAVSLNLLFPPSAWLNHFMTLERFSRQGDNDCIATRRAIVRAAAEIGKTMP